VRFEYCKCNTAIRLKHQLIRIMLIGYHSVLQVDGHIQRLDKDLKKFEEELRKGTIVKLNSCLSSMLHSLS
jgi:hypothetical protein